MPVGTPFEPGQSGNPAGRKVGSVSLKGILRRLLDTRLPNEPDLLDEGKARDMTAGEKLVMNLVIRALADGDARAIKDIIEMLEGKPAQSLSLAGDPDHPLQVDSRLEVVLVRPNGSQDG
jgi:hypothetical protein